MPKDTFGNLPKNKQEMILDAALDEFYAYGYEKASISRIVERAEIAKGSYYQYFTGKEDLFILLLTSASEKKMQYLSTMRSQAGELSLFDLLRVLYERALDFIKDNPKLSAVTDRFLKSGNTALKEKVLGDGIEKSSGFMAHLLLTAIEKQEIRNDIDIPFTSYLLTSMSIALGDYVRAQRDDLADLDEQAYRSLIEPVLDLLKRGLTN